MLDPWLKGKGTSHKARSFPELWDDDSTQGLCLRVSLSVALGESCPSGSPPSTAMFLRWFVSAGADDAGSPEMLTKRCE